MLAEHGLSFATSAYYKANQRGRVSDAELAEAYAANADQTVFVANRRPYGDRKMWHTMKRTGHDMGRDQVARQMRIAGTARVVRPRRTITTQCDDRRRGTRI
ncbi:MAG: hypothetical protein EOO27_07865 [Comamonadaceae bacterium]|nr:MAG: hypothetical protein EOO27_07865 [Comamonadaceae bacterium]